MRWAVARRAVVAPLLAGALALGFAGCGNGGDTTTATSTSLPAGARDQLEAAAGVNPEGVSTRVTANSNGVDVYKAPTASTPASRLANPNENGAPRVFLVTAKLPGWYQVLLPVKPNGSTGWVKASQVTAAVTNYRVEVLRSTHRVRVYDRNKLIMDEAAGIGTADTPTPGGRFYLMELLQPNDPNGPYGPYAFGLSGFSASLESFNGRQPVIGIHGTNEPQSLGIDVSHGCIRIRNEAISRLATTLPLGTPVEILA
jgi:lipoprotein-anchoring transpeptidase ErfK/SrfK